MTAAACKSAKERSLTFKMSFGSRRGRHLQFVSKRTTAVAASHFVETTSPSTSRTFNRFKPFQPEGSTSAL
ncbi:MAG: hypothetical protein ACTS7I_02490 [Candidatus Hodgkinia cicadicola]